MASRFWWQILYGSVVLGCDNKYSISFRLSSCKAKRKTLMTVKKPGILQKFATNGRPISCDDRYTMDLLSSTVMTSTLSAVMIGTLWTCCPQLWWQVLISCDDWYTMDLLSSTVMTSTLSAVMIGTLDLMSSTVTRTSTLSAVVTGTLWICCAQLWQEVLYQLWCSTVTTSTLSAVMIGTLWICHAQLWQGQVLYQP